MPSRFYDTDLTNAAWAWIAPVLPAARPGGRSRTTNLRAVLNAIFYPADRLPVATVATRISTVRHGLPLLSSLAKLGVWVHLHRGLYEQARRGTERAACPSVVIMDGQSVKTGLPTRTLTAQFGGTIRKSLCKCKNL